MNTYPDLTNKRYRMLVVIKKINIKKGFTHWECLCDCGNYKTTTAGQLNAGHVVSCGCSTNRLKSIANHKHGDGKTKNTTKEYKAWADMKSRCVNKSHKAYKYYGGRGISVCQSWIDSYESFLSDMGRAPSKKHSLDRFPDKNGNYEPSNCRWATALEQQNNIRSNACLEYNGIQFTKAQLIRELGITRSTITYYTNKGYSMAQIVKMRDNNQFKKAK